MSILLRKTCWARCWTTGSSSQDCSSSTNGLRRSWANPEYSTWCVMGAPGTYGPSSTGMCGNRRGQRESSAHFDAFSQFARNSRTGITLRKTTEYLTNPEFTWTCCRYTGQVNFNRSRVFQIYGYAVNRKVEIHLGSCSSIPHLTECFGSRKER